jgi:glycosyltransferase involved in cell wall biosynthesis
VRFSVLLPTRNRLEYLRLAVETVRRQDYTDWEIIVSDNDSQQDVAAYVASLDDVRVRYLRTQGFVSVTTNWNKALDASSGDYVVMLGDDDALMPGYLRTIDSLIARYDQPDLVYTGGYLYAYPGVYPGYPDGLLNEYPKFFGAAPEPFWLDVSRARHVAGQLLHFKRKLGLNMQYSVISRRLIDTLREKGPVFQSPFPDYYTTCALFLTAHRILIEPRPLVAIGITPKSYGFFYYNHREQGGVDFLNSLVVPEALAATVLPGTNSYTSWLVAMEAIKANYGAELGLRVNYRRYRMLQILYGYSEYFRGRSSKAELRELTSRMSARERVLYGGAWRIIALALKLTPPVVHRLLGWAMNRSTRVLRSSIEWEPSAAKTTYRNILEVFEGVTWPAAA